MWQKPYVVEELLVPLTTKQAAPLLLLLPHIQWTKSCCGNFSRWRTHQSSLSCIQRKVYVHCSDFGVYVGLDIFAPSEWLLRWVLFSEKEIQSSFVVRLWTPLFNRQNWKFAKISTNSTKSSKLIDMTNSTKTIVIIDFWPRKQFLRGLNSYFFSFLGTYSKSWDLKVIWKLRFFTKKW